MATAVAFFDFEPEIIQPKTRNFQPKTYNPHYHSIATITILYNLKRNKMFIYY